MATIHPKNNEYSAPKCNITAIDSNEKIIFFTKKNRNIYHNDA